jgi:hypothetical protein
MNKTLKLATLVAVMLLLGAAFFAVSAATPAATGPARNISNLHFPPPTNFEGLRSNFITTLHLLDALHPRSGLHHPG